MWADWITAVLPGAGFHVLREDITRRPAPAPGPRPPWRGVRRPDAGRAIRCLPALPQARGVWESLTADDPAGASGRLIPIRVGEVTPCGTVRRPHGGGSQRRRTPRRQRRRCCACSAVLLDR